jgi:tetratricopeptide (TPR) repeat protein
LALAEKARTLARRSELLRPLAIAERQQGRINEALRFTRDAVQRDPRNAITLHLYADALLWARRYDESREAADRALALAPDVSEMIENRAMVSLAQGDLAEARRVLAVVPSSVDRAQLATAMGMYYDLPGCSTMPISAGCSRSASRSTVTACRGWCFADLHAAQTRPARAFVDTALVAVDEQLARADRAQRHRALLATLGRSAEAVTAGERAVAGAREVDGDQRAVPAASARARTCSSDRTKALDQARAAVADAVLSVAGVAEIDPTFAPLRGKAVRAADGVGAGGFRG